MLLISDKCRLGCCAVLCCQKEVNNLERDQRNTTGMRRGLENKICKELRELELLSLEKTVVRHTEMPKCCNEENGMCCMPMVDQMRNTIF